VKRGIIVVQTRPVDPSREDEYNDWYSNVHVPEIVATPGFVSARRYRAPGSSDYLAIYEIEGDDLHEVRKRMSAGRGTRTPSDAIQTDPPPVVTFYELLED
jgi:hypothetical protein